MKKFNRIVLSALAVVMLVGMMVIPASATQDASDYRMIVSDPLEGQNYYYYGTFTASGNTRTAIATITVEFDGSGKTAPTFSNVVGYIAGTAANGSYHREAFSDPQSSPMGQNVTSYTSTTLDKTYSINVNAACTFYANSWESDPYWTGYLS